MRPRLRGEGHLPPALLAALVLVAFGGSAPSAAGQAAAAPAGQAAAGAGPEIRIVARSKEMTKDRIFATGDVEVHYGDLRLFSDRMEFDPVTRDVLAEGNVVIQVRGEVIRAERAFLNLATGQGRVEQASGMLQPSLLFAAERMERRSDDLYGLSRARLTTCTQPVPRWAFSFSRADLKKDDSIRMWNAVFSVKKVPVFYLPYLSYPLKDRASGFLMPVVGLSGPKGVLYSQSYYWAMARNMDATVGFDAYPKQGLGAGLEYRYLLPGGTGGQVNLYYFSFKRDPPGTKPSPGYVIRLNHNQALPAGFTLAANVDYENSFDFQREFDNDFRQASVSTRSAQVYLSRSWSLFNVSARAGAFETFYTQLDDSIISTSLPQVNVNVFKVRLFSPFYFSLTGGFTNSRYGLRSQYRAGTERRLTSVTVSPTLSLPFSSIPWLNANAAVTVNLAYYGQTLDPGTRQIINDPLFTGNVVARLDLAGPVLYKIFYGKAGEPRLKNIIEPYINYTYDSPVSQADRIVTAFGFFRYHQVSYGVTSRYFIRKGDRPVEALSLGLGQTYYFSPEDGPLSQFPVNGKPPRFSEINGTLRYYPSERLSLDAALAFNPYYHNLSTLRLTATTGSRADGRFLSLNWYRSLNAWIAGVDPSLRSLYNRHQVGASGSWRLRGLPLELAGDIDYNLQTKKLLYTAGQAVYHYQCLDFLFEVRAFYYRFPPETQFKLSVGLGNIGRAAELLGGPVGLGF